MINQDAFNQNLECLKEKNPALHQKLIAFAPANERYEWKDSANGMPNLALKEAPSSSLHSTEDPLKEARQALAGLASHNPRIAVFYGFGLGYIAQAFCEARPPQNDLNIVIEPDIETFHKALQVTNLNGLLSDADFTFIVGETLDALYPKLFRLFSDAKNVTKLNSTTFVRTPRSYALHRDYFHTVDHLIQETRKNALEAYGRLEDTFEGFANTFDNLNLILQSSGVVNLKDSFKKTPAFVISAGPSLDLALPLLHQIEEKGIVIAVDATLKICLDHDIVPHIVTTIERDTCSTPYFSGVTGTEQTALALYPLVPPSVFCDFKGPKIIVYRDFRHFEILYPNKGTIQSGASTSHLAIKIAELMGCDPIVLIGQDLCYHPHTCQSHASGIAIPEMNVPHKSDDRITNDHAFPVPGNTLSSVLTEPGWVRFIRDFEWHIAESSCQFINTSEWGAKIAGAPYRPLPDVLKEYQTQRIDYASRVLKLVPPLAAETVASDANVMRDRLVQGIDFVTELEKRQAEIADTIETIKTIRKQDYQAAAAIVGHLNEIRKSLLDTPIFNWLVLSIIASDHIEIANRWHQLPPLEQSNINDYVLLLQEWFVLLHTTLPRISETLKRALHNLDTLALPTVTEQPTETEKDQTMILY